MRIDELYHTAMVVPDIRTALAYYTDSHGIDFTPPQLRCLDLRDGESEFHIDLTMAYSRKGPHRLELIEAVPGTLWDTPGTDWAIHHLGLWCDDIPGESARLVEAGSPVLATLASDPVRATYLAFHRLPDGTLIELVDSSARQRLESWIASGGPHPGPHGLHARENGV